MDSMLVTQVHPIVMLSPKCASAMDRKQNPLDIDKVSNNNSEVPNQFVLFDSI